MHNNFFGFYVKFKIFYCSLFSQKMYSFLRSFVYIVQTKIVYLNGSFLPWKENSGLKILSYKLIHLQVVQAVAVKKYPVWIGFFYPSVLSIFLHSIFIYFWSLNSQTISKFSFQIVKLDLVTSKTHLPLPSIDFSLRTVANKKRKETRDKSRR